MKFKATIAILALAAASLANAATLTIDNFTTQVDVQDNTADGVAVTSGPQFDPANFLGVRYVSVNLGPLVGSPSLIPADASIAFTNANLALPNNYFGYAIFNYGLLTPLDLGGAGGYFSIVANTDTNTPRLNLTLTVNGVSQVAVLNTANPSLYTFDFASFAGVDFTNVTNIGLRLDALQAGADATILSFSATSDVPEPATFGMIGAGIAALALARRRK